MKKALYIITIIILLLLTACEKANQKLVKILAKNVNVMIQNNGTCIVNGVRLKYSGVVTIKPDYSSGEFVLSENAADISFSGSEKGDSIEVYYKEFAPEDAIISIKGSNIEVTTKSGKPALIYSIKGYIPSDLKLNLSTSSGDIRLENLQGSTNLQASASSGNITLSGCSFPEVDLLSSSGDIALTDCTITDLDALTSSGDIDISNSRIEHVSGQTSSGDVNITNSQIKERHFSTSSGDVNG
jgi:hypothetical protein